MKEIKLLLALNDLEEELLLDALSETVKPVRKFRPGILLVAALLTALLGITAGAVLTEAGWFQQFFEQESHQELTQNQIAVVQASTTEFGQSITRDGYTFTLESLIADQRNCYIKLKITGPEGVAMNNEMGYGDKTPRGPEDLYDSFVPISGKKFSGVGSWQNLPDEDPNDNQVSILVRYALNSYAGYDFETEKQWRLLIRDFSAWGEEEDVVLAKGDIWFDITFDEVNPAQLTFIYEPIPYTFTPMGEEASVEGTITSCTLRPMSGTLTISGCSEARGFNLLPVVMKDGTQVEMRSQIWGNGSYSYTLKAPVDLEEVDHILLNDGTKLYPRVG